MGFPENALLIKSGDLRPGPWGFAANFISQGEEVIELDQLRSCKVVSDRHEAYQTGVGRVAGGIIGGVLLGPIGAAGGLLAGGKRRIDETIILCSFYDGRSFTAECSQLTAAKFSQIAELNASRRFPEAKESTFSIAESPPSVDDSIECPMCAELIKAKAKVCRFCGCKIAEIRSVRIEELAQDLNATEAFYLKNLYDDYVQGVEHGSPYSLDDVRVILKTYISLHEANPNESYRNVVELVRLELGVQYKTPLLELFREGFAFVRRNKKIKFVESDDLIFVVDGDW